jgi:hypothetical protein
MTDLDSASGKNLDMVGDIVTLTRKDAHIIIRTAESAVITDEIYRQVLRYKTISNSCDCTYYDIMDSINLLWDTDNIKYVEPRDRPATVLLTMPVTSLDSIDPSVGRVLAIKPAGVAMIYTIGYWTIIPLAQYERFVLQRINLLWKFMFYGFAMKDTKRLDGTWPLDGSVLLNGALIEVPTHMRNHGILTVHKESVDMGMAASTSLWSREEISCQKSILRVEVLENHRILRVLDGTWNLDGEYLLNEQQWYIPMFMDMYMGLVKNNEYGEMLNVVTRCVAADNSSSVSLHSSRNSTKIQQDSLVDARAEMKAEVECWENISCSLITKKNIWYLNGTQLLDGSRYLNAIEIKEVI